MSTASPTPVLPPDLGLAFRELAAARRAQRWAWLAAGTQSLLLVGLAVALGVGASARAGYWMVTAPAGDAGMLASDPAGWRSVAAAVVAGALTLDERGQDGLGRVGEWLAPPLAARLRSQLAAARGLVPARPLTQTFIPVAVTEVDGLAEEQRAAATVVGYLLLAMPAHGTAAAVVERRPLAVELLAEWRSDGRWQVIRWEEVTR